MFYENQKTYFISTFIAIGIIFPVIFHVFNLSGKIFSPMHIPVMVGGFLLGPTYGMAIGFVTPLLSSLLTGSPALIPSMPMMVFELSGYGFMTGFLWQKTKAMYLSLPVSIVFGRLCALIAAFFLSLTIAPDISPIARILLGITDGLPGILLQLILVPMMVKMLQSNKEISKILEN